MTNRLHYARRTVLGLLLASVPFAVRAQGSLLEQGKGLLGGFGGQPGSTSGGSKGASLSEGEIGGGLKEALRVASQRVTGNLGRADAYFKDPTIQIPLPGALKTVKSMGGGMLIDDLHLKMNRAAEQAAPKALNIFTDAVSKMTVNDARGILSGPNDAATQYFKRTTTGSLTKEFTPIVDTALSSVGAVGVFNSLKGQFNGFGSVPGMGAGMNGFSLTDFTVEKALDGLFHYMGTEEAAIRTNPAARSTDLLKKVFS
jgi:hypothetical protein